ncbi:hypothetical protein BN1723_002070 [Verticillium longisporum]|uniref:Peroxisomal biogenesis factor 11 n=1 Tax=Verticillium longisporum TaxID=100787 RepID=A0A0G4KVS7_VERLO|nr:hypothetical protein BN1723_002070 [Verticillium longisporum]
MVVDALIYHPSVAHYLRFVATTVGRDKLLRTLQYFARFYAWYLLRTNGTAAQTAPWDAIKKQFGLTRKLMRVGKNLGYAGYLSFDMATVLDAVGIRKSPRAKTLQREAYRFWAMGIACSVVAQVYTLYRLQQREARVDKKDGEGVVEGKRIALYDSPKPAPRRALPSPHQTNVLTLRRERAASRLQLLSDVCDLSVPTSALGWVAVDDGLVGLAGTVSSLIGVYTQWKKTA